MIDNITMAIYLRYMKEEDATSETKITDFQKLLITCLIVWRKDAWRGAGLQILQQNPSVNMTSEMCSSGSHCYYNRTGDYSCLGTDHEAMWGGALVSTDKRNHLQIEHHA